MDRPFVRGARAHTSESGVAVVSCVVAAVDRLHGRAVTRLGDYVSHGQRVTGALCWHTPGVTEVSQREADSR